MLRVHFACCLHTHGSPSPFSLGLSLLAGSVGTFIWFLLDHERWQLHGSDETGFFSQTLATTGLAVTNLVDSFKFFPSPALN